MNWHVHVFLLLLFGRLLAASPTGHRLEEQIAKEKEKMQQNEDVVEQLEQKVDTLHHDVKVVTGYRGKPSRLDKLEKENQLKLCWWPDNFMNYAYAYMDVSLPIPAIYGIHFQVPLNMKAFKFTKRPTNEHDHFLRTGRDLDQEAHYFVTLITGQYDQKGFPFAGPNDAIGMQFFSSRDILYSGRNPPSEFPVKHKDHIYVQVVYSDYNPMKRTRNLLLDDDGPIYRQPPFVQVCRCSDMSARVGAPVGAAAMTQSFIGPIEDGGIVITSGGYRTSFTNSASEFSDVYSDSDSDDYMTWSAPFLVCPLIPLEASRCF